MKRYSTSLVIAETFGMDYSDMKEYQYQPGRSNKPIYNMGNDYYCASKIGVKPAKHWTMEFEWKEYKSSFADNIGWQVWECKC